MILKTILTIAVLFVVGCATSPAKKLEVSNQQIEQVIANIKAKTPRPLILAKISKFVNVCNEDAMFGGVRTRDGVAETGMIAIPYKSGFHCVYQDNDVVTTLSTIFSCAPEAKSGFETINCLQKRLPNTNDYDKDALVKLSAFRTEDEFKKCIRKFSNEISGRDSIKESSFQDCVLKIRYGKSAEQLRFTDEYNETQRDVDGVSHLSAYIRYNICASDEIPKDGAILSQSKDTAFALHYLSTTKNQDLLKIRKALQCE